MHGPTARHMHRTQASLPAMLPGPPVRIKGKPPPDPVPRASAGLLPRLNALREGPLALSPTGPGGAARASRGAAPAACGRGSTREKEGRIEMPLPAPAPAGVGGAPVATPPCCNLRLDC